MVIINSKMVTNKNVCKIKQSILYLIFSLSEFINTISMIFADIAFVTIVDRPSIMLIISSQIITESSTILFKYLLFSQIHVLGFQL